MKNIHKLLVALIVFSTSAQAATYEYIFEANFGQRITPAGESYDGEKVSFSRQVWSVILDEDAKTADITATGSGVYRGEDNNNGEAQFRLEASIHNLDIGVDSVTGNAVDAVGRANAYGTGSVTVAASNGAATDIASYNVMAKHANINNLEKVRNYGWLVGSGAFNFILGDTNAGRSNFILDAWFHMGMNDSVSLFGRDVNLAGDLHSTELISKTEVPEPMTSALLLGGLGVISRFRKSVSV